MSLNKCQKYLHKLLITDANDAKFKIYLTKLNFWYNQWGGDKTDKTDKITYLTKTDSCVNKEYNTEQSCTEKCVVDTGNIPGFKKCKWDNNTTRCTYPDKSLNNRSSFRCK